MENKPEKEGSLLLGGKTKFFEDQKLETHDLPNFLIVYLTKTPNFGVHALPSMSTPTLSLDPTQDDHSSSIDLIKNVEPFSSLSLFSVSLSTCSCQKRPFFFFLFSIHLSYLCGPRCATCPFQSRVHFCPKMIYLFSVQFILNEFSSSHFVTSEIFIKISSLESLATHHPENHKKFQLSKNSTKLFWFTRFRKKNPTA